MLTRPATPPNTSVHPSLEGYAHFLARLEELLTTAWQQYGSRMACKTGCFGCCKNDFKVSRVEAEAVRRAAAALPEETQKALTAQLNEPDRTLCPLLIDGQCSVYESRPVLCRIFGFPVTDGEMLATCELNFTDERAGEFSGQAFDTRRLSETTRMLSQVYGVQAGELAELSDEPPMKRLTEWLVPFS